MPLERDWLPEEKSKIVSKAGVRAEYTSVKTVDASKMR